MGKKRAASPSRHHRGAVIGERLRAVRLALGLHQADLFGLVRFHAHQVSAAENETRDIHAARLRALCLALDVSADFLLGLSDRSEREAVDAWVDNSGKVVVRVKKRPRPIG